MNRMEVFYFCPSEKASRAKGLETLIRFAQKTQSVQS